MTRDDITLPTAQGAIQKLLKGDPLTAQEELLARAAYALIWLAERGATVPQR